MGAGSCRVTTRDAGHERAYRGLLRLYPAEFRRRFSNEMAQLFGDQLRDARIRGAPAGAAVTWLRALGDVAVTAASEHTRRNRTVAHSLTTSPPASSRVLGLAGILGGVVLIAALLIDLSPELNTLRLILFNAGAMAVVIGVHRRQVAAAPILAWAVATAALVANAWSLAMVVLPAGGIDPLGAGGFGLVLFAMEVSMWLAHAAFGLVSFRLGVVSRLGALALAVGSVLAIMGIDRLGLTSADAPTIFGTLALAGIALNGIGWILLGLDVATRRRALPEAEPRGAPPRG
jgi:hypothetical protein